MRSAIFHVTVLFIFCAALANTNSFSDVEVDSTYDHYAEKRNENMPAFSAMPFNCLVNLAYIFMGSYWLFWYRGGKETEQSCYSREVFALMAVLYAPVQWARSSTSRRAPAVLDQWLTLPIFAWVPVWIDFIESTPGSWRVSHAAVLEMCSVASYGSASAHERGFEVALGCHVASASYRGVRVQSTRGDGRTAAYLVLAMLSCAGFVVSKSSDHRLARYWIFQRLTGHFWSKVCDVMQFHYSFCFSTELTDKSQRKTAAKQK